MIPAYNGGSRATASSSTSGTSSENQQQHPRIQEGRRSLAAQNVVVIHDPNARAAAMAGTSAWVPSDDTPPPPPPSHVALGSAKPAPLCSSNHELIILKEARRLEKNRVKARNARKRKKCMIADLERNVKVVTEENKILRVENADLKRKLVEAEIREGKAVAAANAVGRHAHQNQEANIALAATASNEGSVSSLSTVAGMRTGAGAALDDLFDRHMQNHQYDLNRRLSHGQRHGRAEQLLRDHPTGDDLASQLIKRNSWAPQPPESLSELPAFRDAIHVLPGEDIRSSSRMRGVPGGIAATVGDLNGGGGGLPLSSLRQPCHLTSPARINISSANGVRLPLLEGRAAASASASVAALSFLEHQKRQNHHHVLRGIAGSDAARCGGDDLDILTRRGGGTS